jgi:very-short-patch-repair endonuclease
MNEQNFESSDNESSDDVPITVSDKGDGELILNELIVYNYDVRHEFSEEYFVGYQIASLLGYANTKQVIINNVSKCNRLIFRDLPDDIKKPELNPKTILINRDGAIEILIKTRKRISPDVLHILKSFRIETTNKKCLTKEQQTLSALTNAFKTEKFEDQFKVGKYFLDLYFPEYKIVVECDENGHADRKPCNERERMDFVNEKLELTDENWIRYNPDAEDFDISKVIGKIYRTIDYIKTKKFELETKKLEEYLQNQIPVNNQIQQIKLCSTCREEKPLTDFYANKSNRDGLEIRCKDCRKNHKMQYKVTMERIEVLNKICPQCKEDKLASEYYKNSDSRDNLRKICKDCCKKMDQIVINTPKIVTETKNCSTCKVNKNIDDFFKRKKSYDGYTGVCKICINERNDKKRDSREIIVIESKTCSECKINKNKEAFGICKDSPDGYKTQCKSCLNEKSKIYKTKRETS